MLIRKERTIGMFLVDGDGRDFPHIYRSALGPTHNETLVNAGEKAAGTSLQPPPLSGAVVQERIALYLCPLSVTSWNVIG